jgi:anti-anti-sigma factor
MTTTDDRFQTPMPSDPFEQATALDVHVLASTGSGPAVVRLAGEIDMQTRDTLVTALGSLASPSSVIIDMSEVTFMDSAGLHVLIDTHRRAPVTIRSPQPFVRRLLELSGLLDVFEFDLAPDGDRPHERPASVPPPEAS